MPIIEQVKAEYSATVDPKPFKDREEVKTEIRDCGLTAAIFQYACFIFAALGVIGDALNMTLGLEPMSWLLLAIVAGLNAIIGHTRFTVARHLLGLETLGKKIDRYSLMILHRILIARDPDRNSSSKIFTERKSHHLFLAIDRSYPSGIARRLIFDSSSSWLTNLHPRFSGGS